MIHSVRFRAVLDANVIYPVVIRDLLFWFAHYDLFTPKWSKQIFVEWERVMERKGVSKEEIQRRVLIANKAFPDALVNNYDEILNIWNYLILMIATYWLLQLKLMQM